MLLLTRLTIRAPSIANSSKGARNSDGNGSRHGKSLPGRPEPHSEEGNQAMGHVTSGNPGAVHRGGWDRPWTGSWRQPWAWSCSDLWHGG